MSYTYSEQLGIPGHCYQAQVFGPDGKSVLIVEPTPNPQDATAMARRCSDALNATWPTAQERNDPLISIWAIPRGGAWDRLLSERERQVTVEGWTLAHDNAYTHRELAKAAACYALSAAGFEDAVNEWPWLAMYFKPTTPARDLEKAGALILAEMGRLDRLKGPAA